MEQKLRKQPELLHSKIGIDEAGRGCIAGPVVAAAVLLPEAHELHGLNDSKKLTPRKREELAPMIRKTALAWGIGIIWQQRIDSTNILQSTFEAMARAAAGAARKMATEAFQLAIDGNMTIPDAVLKKAWPRDKALPRQRAIIRGDELEPAISAASILAKTCRDRIMQRLARSWPEYGFARHKGYGTAAHYAALATHGPCPLHRLTFRGVANDAG